MTADYILIDSTNVQWPGCLPWRGPTSLRGYPTREAAEERARVIRAHAAARALGGPDLRVYERATGPTTHHDPPCDPTQPR